LHKAEVERLWKCLVCGRAWASKQSLRAHMRVHKGEGYRHTSILVRSEEYARFEAMCTRHNTTTCHLLGVLIRAALKGDETGMIDIGAPNPAVINVHEYFLGKPRSGWKAPVPVTPVTSVGPGRCPECGSSDVLEESPFRDGFRQGRCKKCGADWAVKGRPPKLT